jgi:L-fuculose-phosphate aldolase
MIRIGRMCYERNLLVSLDGNLSALLPGGEVLCTRAGCHKGYLEDDDLIVVDRKGAMLRGTGRPTSEIYMHLACYDERPDVHAVVHTHPPMSIAFTIAGQSMARCVLPEVVLTLGTVPTVNYETTGTHALADKIRPYVAQHDAILMDRHGAVTLGADLFEAYCRLETMEHTATITKLARDMGRVRELPPDEAQKLRSMGLKRYGGPPEAVAKADAPGADLPPACQGCSGCDNPSPTGIGPSYNLRMARVVEGALQSVRNLPAAPPATARSEAPPASGAVLPAAHSFEEAVVAEVLRALGAG